jgi:DNA-binding NtrC family response regulator
MSTAVQRDFEAQSPTLNAGPEICTLQQYRLEVIEGPDAGKVLVSSGARLSIGNDPGAELQLSDSQVAPFHCEIVATAEGIDIREIGSNSTQINDVEVSKARLRGPVTITVGESQIRFEPTSANLYVRRSANQSFADLIGSSVAMRELFCDLERVSCSETPVLLLGETGTGKAAVARAIHRQSPRRAGSFHIVDCTAPHREIERGLISAFENAAGGTLYLEQVGEMPADLQSRLLRVFKNGGPGAVADLRIMSSSSVDLRQAINQGSFDSRLFRHLSGEKVSVPPMRERLADLPRLVNSLLDELGASTDPLAEQLRSREVLERLQRYRWPGNVRELREHLKRCVQQKNVFAAGEAAANVNQGVPAEVSPDVDISRPIKAGREEWIKHFERMYLSDILEAQGGNVTRAAKAAGVDRGHFYRLMMRCGLRSS